MVLHASSFVHNSAACLFHLCDNSSSSRTVFDVTPLASPSRIHPRFFDLFTMGSLSVICLAITSFSYFKVFCIIKRQQLQVVAINQASQNLGQPAAINLTKYRKSVSTILYILLLFWGTFLPQAICVSIVFFNNNRADAKMAYSIFHVAATLCFLSSALNPLLYNWRLKDIRQEVKLLIRKIACKN